MVFPVKGKISSMSLVKADFVQDQHCGVLQLRGETELYSKLSLGQGRLTGRGRGWKSAERKEALNKLGRVLAKST